MRFSSTARASLALVSFVVVAACKSSTPDASGSDYTIQTPSVSIAASSEKYMCWAVTLDHDLAVDEVSYVPKSYVHHVLLSQATAPEPEGLSECNVAFKTTWLPIFISGKGGDSLQYPAGAANVLKKGTQLVMQLHLLNATANDETLDVAMSLHNSTLPNPTPVGIYAFGTQLISLPPLATTTVTNECTVDQDVTAFAMFAHEHQLGTKMTLETMDANGKYNLVYSRDPYDFNNQTIEQQPLTIPKGTKTRITCTYDNTTSSTVTYGESTYNEMCYFVTFMPGQSGTFGCVQSRLTTRGLAPTVGMMAGAATRSRTRSASARRAPAAVASARPGSRARRISTRSPRARRGSA